MPVPASCWRCWVDWGRVGVLGSGGSPISPPHPPPQSPPRKQPPAHPGTLLPVKGGNGAEKGPVRGCRYRHRRPTDPHAPLPFPTGVVSPWHTRGPPRVGEGGLCKDPRRPAVQPTLSPVYQRPPVFSPKSSPGTRPASHAVSTRDPLPPRGTPRTHPRPHHPHGSVHTRRKAPVAGNAVSDPRRANGTDPRTAGTGGAARSRSHPRGRRGGGGGGGKPPTARSHWLLRSKPRVAIG